MAAVGASPAVPPAKRPRADAAGAAPTSASCAHVRAFLAEGGASVLAPLARCCVERPPQGPDGAPWSSMVRARFRDATRARDSRVHP